MNEIFTEKYRPSLLKEIALSKAHQGCIMKLLENPKSIPSLIFYSSSPGTGKTTTAKAISNELKCDMLMINSSDERGIDSIREKVSMFSRSLSSTDDTKRMVFLDEADGLTKQAQDALRNLMEECSDNCFFILSCNDISKIIEPIKSRCVVFNFEQPDKDSICDYLADIVLAEKIEISAELLEDVMNRCYPDIRRMVLRLQGYAIDKNSIVDTDKEFNDFFKLLKNKNVGLLYEFIFSKSIDLSELNRCLFRKVFDDMAHYNMLDLAKISERLADNEKYFYLGANKEIVFMNNILAIINLF